MIVFMRKSDQRKNKSVLFGQRKKDNQVGYTKSQY